LYLFVKGAIGDVVYNDPRDYRWSSVAHYVNGADDGITDTDVYFGRMDPVARKAYADELMSDLDDDLMRRHKMSIAVGAPAFAARLKRSGGRERRKRGRPVNSVLITS